MPAVLEPIGGNTGTPQEVQVRNLRAAVSQDLTVSLPASAFLISLIDAAKAAGMQPAELIGAELADAVLAFGEKMRTLVGGLHALEQRRGYLQQWVPGAGELGPIWGIARGAPAPDANLGLALPVVPWVAKVLIGSGAVATAAWYVSDVLGLSSATRDEAELLRQKTRAELLARAKVLRGSGREGGAEAIERALADADKSAEKPVADIFDRLVQSLGVASAGAGIGAFGVLAILWAMGSLRRPSRKKNAGRKRGRRVRR